MDANFFHLVFSNHVVQFWKESKKQEETAPNSIMFVSLKWEQMVIEETFFFNLLR